MQYKILKLEDGNRFPELVGGTELKLKDWSDFNFFCHLRDGKNVISEFSAGGEIASAWTLAEATIKALSNLNKVGKEKFSIMIQSEIDKTGFILNEPPKNEYLEALIELMDAIPKQTENADWWEDDLTRAFDKAKVIVDKAG